MAWLTPLPGFQRSPTGLEWRLWQRLPAILAWGTAVPGLVAAMLWLATPELAATAADKAAHTQVYFLLGLIALHWTLTLTLAIGCGIVIIMKGQAYVADAYPPAERDQPG